MVEREIDIVLKTPQGNIFTSEMQDEYVIDSGIEQVERSSSLALALTDKGKDDLIVEETNIKTDCGVTFL